MASQVKTESAMKPAVDQFPNKLIYGASIVSVALSLITVKKNPTIANFFGLWAPTILGLGILMKENKLLEMNRRLPVV
jgi:hypothetical protein